MTIPTFPIAFRNLRWANTRLWTGAVDVTFVQSEPVPKDTVWIAAYLSGWPSATGVGTSQTHQFVIVPENSTGPVYPGLAVGRISIMAASQPTPFGMEAVAIMLPGDALRYSVGATYPAGTTMYMSARVWEVAIAGALETIVGVVRPGDLVELPAQR